MKRRFYLIPVVAFLFGSAFLLQEPPSTQAQSFAATEQFVVVRGSTLWDLASEKCGDALRWREIYDLNSYLEMNNRLSHDNRGRPIVRVYPGEQLIIPTAGCEQASAIVTLAETDVGSPPQTITVTAVPWWAWVLLIIALAAIAYLLYDRRLLKRAIATLNDQLLELGKHHAGFIASLHDRHERELAEQRRDLDFRARRMMMPPLPEGVDDAVFAGPPIRFEGITPENRERELTMAAVEAYTRLHHGAYVVDITVERRNERRVLVSSRPGETVEVTFGKKEGRSEVRPVTLVREPGWILDAIFRRNGEVVQELTNICVLGFCANRICYTTAWLENCLVEPYESAAVHSVPDWGTVRAEQASRRLILRSVGGGRVIAVLGVDAIIEADRIVLETEGELKPDGDGLVVGGPMRLTPGETRVESDTFPVSGR